MVEPLSQPSKEWCTPMAEFCMPSLGTDMEAGTLVEWLVHPGGAKRGAAISSPWWRRRKGLLILKS